MSGTFDCFTLLVQENPHPRFNNDGRKSTPSCKEIWIKIFSASSREKDKMYLTNSPSIRNNN